MQKLLCRIFPDLMMNQGERVMFYLFFVIHKPHCYRSNHFAITDTDGDGKITFAEWRDSAVRSNFSNGNNSTLSTYWARYDTANVGYLTKDEAIKRRA
jgi:hypothetical protein